MIGPIEDLVAEAKRAIDFMDQVRADPNPAAGCGMDARDWFESIVKKIAAMDGAA